MNKEKYIEFIHTFINDNYNELFTICKKDCSQTEFEPEELLSEFYLYCLENQGKITNLKDYHIQDGYNKGYMLRFAAQWCYNSIRLYSANTGLTNFKSKFQKKNVASYENLNDETKFPTEEINTEEHEKWLVENFSDDVIEKLNLLEFIVENELSPLQKKLYELHFIKGYKPKQLKIIFPDIKSHSFNKMFDEMKQTIKNKADEYEKE